MEINTNTSIFDYTNLVAIYSDQQSQNALGNAIELMTSGNYKRAIQEFQRSITLSPYNR